MFVALKPKAEWRVPGNQEYVEDRIREVLVDLPGIQTNLTQPIAMSAISDCYQPVERRLQLTRRCLAVLAEFRNPVGIVTKNHLVTRDIDVLRELARHNAAAVFVSVTTLDAALTPRLEPRASLPAMRLRAIEQLHAAGDE